MHRRGLYLTQLCFTFSSCNFFIYLNQIFSDQLNNKETKNSTSLNILTKTIRFRLTKDYAVLTNQACSNLQKESFPHKFLRLRDKTCNLMQKVSRVIDIILKQTKFPMKKKINNIEKYQMRALLILKFI